MKISILVIVLNIILSATNAFSQTPYLYNNFPLHLDSIRDPFRKAGIPLISDLDKDGQKEIITYAVDYEGAANPLSQL